MKKNQISIQDDCEVSLLTDAIVDRGRLINLGLRYIKAHNGVDS